MDAQSGLTAGAAPGEAGNMKSQGKSGDSGQAGQGTGFLSLLVRAAGADAEKTGTQTAGGKKQSATSRAELKEELLEFFNANYPGLMDRINTDKGAAALHGGPAAGPGDLEFFLQNPQAGGLDLLRAFVLQLRSGPKDADAAPDAQVSDVLEKLLAYMTAAGVQGVNAAGKGLPELTASDLKEILQRAETGGENTKADAGRQPSTAFPSQHASRVFETAGSRAATSDMNNPAQGAKQGNATDVQARLRAFLSPAGGRDAAASEKDLTELEKDGRQGQKETNGQIRGDSRLRHASRVLEALDHRTFQERMAGRSDGAKQGNSADMPANLRALFNAAGDKGADAAKTGLPGMKESLQNLAKGVQTGKAGVKPGNTEPPGPETLDPSRISASPGGVKSQNNAFTVRHASGSFDSQLKAEEARVLSQVSVRLSAGIRQGSKNMTIHMHPPDLGRVKVRIISEGSNLNVQLHSQNHQVAGILERHLPGLQQSLADQGVSVTNLQVNVDSGHDQGGSQFEEQGFGASNRHAPGKEPAAEDESPAAPDPEPATLPGGHAQGLSLRV